MLASVLLVATCAPTMATSVSKEMQRIVCEIWLPITWVDADTDQTILEVKQNNARRNEFCK